MATDIDMKKLLVIPFILLSVMAFSQVTSNPFIVDPTGTTAFEVDITPVSNASRLSQTTLIITVPSTNNGTVQWNTEGSTMTTVPAISAASENKVYLLTIRGSVYFKFSNASDVVYITW